jgi:predicted branched-subunit amino acid permease
MLTRSQLLMNRLKTGLVCSEGMRGIRTAIPVMLGFVPFGLVLGAQAVQMGFHVFEVPLMTGMNFGGGSEFVALSLWSSPPELLLIVAMTFLVNCRHLLMGAALAPFIQHLPKRTILPALFFMCDESWAMALTDRQHAHA